MFLASEKRQFQIFRGSAPDPAGGLTAPPRPPAGFGEPPSKPLCVRPWKGCASKPNCNTHFDLLRKAVTGGRFSLIISERIPFVLMRKKKKKILEEKSVQMSNAEENTKLAKLRSILSTITECPCKIFKALRSHLSLSVSKHTKRYLPVGVLLLLSVHAFFQCFCVRSRLIRIKEAKWGSKD